MATMKNYRLYLFRHGITAANLNGLYIGSGTDEPLCPEGIARLKELKQSYGYPSLTTVFSSPMVRAVESAELLFPDAKDKIVLQDLRENHFGAFEGRPVTELVKDSDFQQWITPGAGFTPAGGESTRDFHLRCSTLLMKLFEYMMKSGVEEAACVTHGGVMMSMLAQTALPRRTPEEWMADPGCGYLLQCDAALWMRDGLAEATAVLPFGYL